MRELFQMRVEILGQSSLQYLFININNSIPKSEKMIDGKLCKYFKPELVEADYPQL